CVERSGLPPTFFFVAGFAPISGHAPLGTTGQSRCHHAPPAGRGSMLTEFQAAINQLIHEKDLPQDVVMEAVANALLSAYRKTNAGGDNIRIEVEKNGEVHVWASKRVVAQVANPTEEISLGEAQRLNPHAALGQHIEVDSPQIFNKIPAQTAKQ